MIEFFQSLSEDELTQLARFVMCFVVCFGAIVGSFLNVCIYRIPLNQSVVTPRSHCFSCGKLIPWYCNIPILSWIVLRGKCANCKAEISPRYLIVEALTALLFLFVFLKWGNPFLLHMDPLNDPLLIPVFWVVVCGLIVGALIDLDHFIILDSLTYGGMAFGLIMSAALPSLHHEVTWQAGLIDSGIGLAVGFGTLFAIAWLGEIVFKKEAMGFGDVKWLGAFGALFGWKGAIFIVVVSSLVGAVSGIILMLRSKAKAQTQIPYGPYLAIAAAIWLFWGNALVSAYIAFLTR